MANKFTYSLDLVENEELLASLGFTVLVEWDVDEDFEPSAAAADHICNSTGYFAAYPYARELVQSLSTRLQLDPLVLGTLARGTKQPSGISAVHRSSAPPEDEAVDRS